MRCALRRVNGWALEWVFTAASGVTKMTRFVRCIIIRLSYLDLIPVMETKSARFTILIDPVKKEAFENLCAAQDLTPSQVVRQLIREYLEQHGVTYKTKNVIGARARRKSA